MNRCPAAAGSRRTTLQRLLLGASLAAIGLASTAQTSVRQFPQTALRGELVVTAAPAILLDGKADRLSPGARIRGTQNTVLMSNTLIGQHLVVNYTREAAGMVHDVWVLTPAEAAMPRKRAGD